jgi:hypothetical protein
MKQKTLTAIVLSLAGMFGSGCDSNVITEYDLRNPPTVIRKEHETEQEYDADEYNYLWLYGELMVMNHIGTTRMVDDEDFILYLKNSRGEEKNVYVRKDLHEYFKVGDKCYLNAIDYETSDPDYKK